MGGTDTSILFGFSSYQRSDHRFAIASNIINLVVTMVTGTTTPGSARLLLLSGSGEPAPCQCRAAPARPTMRAVHAAARWKLQVDEASEDSVLDRWMANLLQHGVGVGHWRRLNKPFLRTQQLKYHKNNEKREGDLLQCGEMFATWNLFMFEELGGNMEAFEQRLKAHPFLATLGRQADNPLGGHLSTWNCGFRTCRNFSVLCGYTKNEDGGLRTQRQDGTIGQQMTHLWMKMTHANDASQSNLELVANLLCEIARYELPYPHAFGQARLDKIRKALPAAVQGDQDARSQSAGASSSRGGTASGTHSALSPEAPLGRPSVQNRLGHARLRELTVRTAVKVASRGEGPARPLAAAPMGLNPAPGMPAPEQRQTANPTGVDLTYAIEKRSATLRRNSTASGASSRRLWLSGTAGRMCRPLAPNHLPLNQA